jgi:catechol 2,3-dioxygenase
MDFKVRRSGHIVISVADVERSAKFFTEVVGLNLIGSTARDMHFLTADFEANHHMVLVRPAKPGARPSDAGSRIGLAAASFEVASMEGLKSLYKRLVDFGAGIDRSEDRGSIKALFASDPDGNLFEFYCRDPDAEPGLADYFAVRGDLDAELATAVS